MKNLKFILRYAQPEGKRVLAILIDVVLYTTFLLTTPLILSTMMDNIINELPIDNTLIAQGVELLGGREFLRENLWIGGALVLLSYSLVAFGIHRRAMNCGILSETFSQNLRNKMYDHMQKLPFSYHKMKDSGDLIQRSTSDIDTIRRFLSGQISELCYSILIISLSAMVMLSRSVKLTIIGLCLTPLTFLVTSIFYRVSKALFKECDESESRMLAVLQENLNGTRVVKAFNQEINEINKFENVNEDFRDKLEKVIHALAIYWNVSDFIGTTQIFILIMAGIHFAMKGEITVGTFSIFISYESMIVWPIRQLGRIISDMGKISVAIHRLQEVLDEKMEDLESGIKPDIKGEIIFDHVDFAYEDSSVATLHDISLHIKPHSKVAIMGPTGSGKSSLVLLMNGIYDYQKGSIKIDGHELRDINKAWLRKHVQIVLQEPFLYSKTIYDNIRLAASADTEEVRNVAKTASIDHVIQEFDKGYDTEVGEKGVTLSGGQKQRVAIARTLMLKSPVVVFDDSLSALDSKTDASIQKSLNELDYPVTTIMITHRINSARSADQIIVLEDGRIAQCGTHDELVQQEGLYRRIYEIQQEGGEESCQKAS